MTGTARHSVSVAAVIVGGEDQVLLIRRRDNGHWEPPGGVLERDESIEEGLRREVHEEIGADVLVEKLTGVYKNMTRGVVALVFRCLLVSAPAGASAEAASVEWKSVAEIEMLMSDAFAVRVLDALDGASSPHVRAHDGTRVMSSD